MDDREIVAAIVAGDLAGLAAACDEHAESLYGYCRWMLSEPEDATGALQDTFVIAADRLGGLRDPRKLRPWLYAVARNECYRRLRAAQEAGLDEAAELAGLEPTPPIEPGADAPSRAELRRLVRTALDELSPAEREVLELDLRHDLQGADLAAVLGVPRNQAQALASHARGELVAALGPLFVARTGRRGCAELDLLLDGWDGQLTGPTSRASGSGLPHIEPVRCLRLDRQATTARVAAAACACTGMALLAAPPPGLPATREVLELCADFSPLPLVVPAGRDGAVPAAFRPRGFPQPHQAAQASG